MKANVTSLCFVAAATFVLSGTAIAAWSDNFDSYASGSNLNGQGGWFGWDGVATCGDVVSSVALSSPNSAMIDNGDDTVHSYTGVNAGAWTYTAWMFIPDDFTGKTYFILLNTYNNGGPYSWSVQLTFDAATGKVTDDIGSSNSLPFIKGAWTEIKVDFNLTTDTKKIYYGGNLLGASGWKNDGVLALAAVDLYSEGSPVYYDDLSLVPEPGTLAALALGLGTLVLRRRR